MYYKQKKNWGVIVLVSILGLSNLSLMNTLVSSKFKTPYPNLNLPVGPYTSYDLLASEDGYRLSYRSNDPAILQRTKKSKLNLRETYTMGGGVNKEPTEGTLMTEKDLACLKVEGSGNSTGRVVGASVGVKAAPLFSNVPIVGWLAAGFVTMFAQDKGSEIGGQVARDFNDC